MPHSARFACSLSLLLAFACMSSSPGSVSAGAETQTTADWNDAAIDWLSYQDGIDRIQITGTPGLLVFYTTWCPHCHNYSRVFHNAEIVALAKQFVMIRVDRDAELEISARYAKGENYIPRTLFLDGKASVDWQHKGSNEGYPYFLDEHRPGELLGMMRSFEGLAPEAADPSADSAAD